MRFRIEDFGVYTKSNLDGEPFQFYADVVFENRRWWGLLPWVECDRRRFVGRVIFWSCDKTGRDAHDFGGHSLVMALCSKFNLYQVHNPDRRYWEFA